MLQDMKDEEKLMYNYGKDGGFLRPEGYIDLFADALINDLPEIPVVQEQSISRWQRVKPYVYLAAMFAGIWLMMNLYHRISESTASNFENPPAYFAQAMNESAFSDIYLSTSSNSDYELEREVAEYYDSMEDFKKDFAKTN